MGYFHMRFAVLDREGTSMHPTQLLITCASLVFAGAACKKAPPPSGSPEVDLPKPTAPAAFDARPSPPSNEPAAQDATRPANANETAPGPAGPSAFVQFEDLLIPLVREPRSEARSLKTCEMIEKLRIASLAVQKSMPKGADEKSWEAASNEMSGAFEGMGATCADVPPNDSPDLAIIHKSYARLLELMPE